jgi:hypothetical protein
MNNKEIAEVALVRQIEDLSECFDKDLAPYLEQLASHKQYKEGSVERGYWLGGYVHGLKDVVAHAKNLRKDPHYLDGTSSTLATSTDE